jgi:hypothetical protein
MNCSICNRALGNPSDPLSIDCGGDCWGCVGEIEAQMGNVQSLVKVREESAQGLRPNWIEPKYEEIIMCDGNQDEGVIHIKVAALPYLDPVEFNTAEARAFAEKILRAVEHVEAGWVGGKGAA